MFTKEGEPAGAAHHWLMGWGTSPRVAGAPRHDDAPRAAETPSREEPTSPGPEDRLRQVCAVAGIQPAGNPRRVASGSNDAWLVDDHRLGALVLRIAWRGDLTRLNREAAVLRQAPDGVHTPQLIQDGRTSVDGLPVSYAVTRRIEGQMLAQRWSALTMAERRSAVAQLAQALRQLHQWTPPPALAELLCARPPSYLDTADWVVGADLHVLPPSRVLALARNMPSLPHLDRGLVTACIDAIEELSDLDVAVDDPALHGLIHADAHLHNVWWSEPGTVTLLDFEWVRFGPPDLELQPLCDIADEDVRSGHDQYPSLLRWLKADYPELFQAPDLPARLRFYSLVYVLRQVVITAPDNLAGYVHRLQRLVNGQWPSPGAIPDLG
jgi:Ser/Thr protein kinase RdoA (MazF antagonist)